MKKQNSQSGFTLIELMVAVAILAILLMIAVPAMEESGKRSAVQSHQRDFQSALSFARGEAVTRNKRISMCPSNDGASCDTGSNDWTNGWLIFVDNGAGGNFGNGDLNGDELLLRVYEYDGNNTAVVVDPGDGGTGTTSVNSLTWNFRGFMQNDQRALVVICEADGEARLNRGLMIERSGRVLSSKDLDNDSIHDRVFEDADGDRAMASLSCRAS